MEITDSINGSAIRILFSNNLRRLRSLQNISQLTLANQAGLTHNFINDIENCKKWVSPQTIAKLATVLRVEPYQFFLPEARANAAGDNVFSVYLDDFSDSLQKMVGDLKKRYLHEEEEEEN
ncbi:MAG: helix-turn-helix domain-containing protein [Treponema sp.]|jgi:transcriptional regulator with XRE-family HTH domain|nr:helix-turn-helix domain-containing protein [Treponema sp.]